VNGETIKSFLVGLSFDVDSSSLEKFTKSIAIASAKVVALGTAIAGTAAAIFHGISKISESFEDMGYQMRLVAPQVNKFLILRQAMLEAYGKAGIDLVKVVKQSILFNFALTRLKYTLDAIYKSVGAKFLPLLTKQMDIFRLKIYQNMPKIQEQLTKFVSFIFKAFAAVVQLGTTLWSVLGRLWDFFAKLDEITGGWSTKILLAVAAWKLLNLEFLLTPLGAIIAGLGILLGFYDDFKVWERGGESFFNWAPVVPIINSVSNALSSLLSIATGQVKIVIDLFSALLQLIKSLGTGDYSGLKDKFLTVFKDISAEIQNVIGYFKSLLNLASFIPSIGAIGEKFLNGHFGAGSGLSNATMGPSLPPGNNVNQKVTMQNEFNIHGASDAHLVGKAVANEQNNVIRDATRNFLGPTQ
jgi:hypothetical protein